MKPETTLVGRIRVEQPEQHNFLVDIHILRVDSLEARSAMPFAQFSSSITLRFNVSTLLTQWSFGRASAVSR